MVKYGLRCSYMLDDRNVLINMGKGNTGTRLVQADLETGHPASPHPPPQTPTEQMQTRWDLTSLSGGQVTAASKLALVSQTC